MQAPIRLKLFVLLSLMLFAVAAIAADGVSARLDRNKIAEGETVVLTVTASGGVSGDPDVSALAKDFDLIDRRQGMKMQIINGRSSSSRDWQFTLAPRRSGTLDIPAIKIGSATTMALQLDVLPPDEMAKQSAGQGAPRPVMLEIETSAKKPYVQQKVIYTVRLLTSGPLNRASLSDPSVNGAIVERLGKETRYQTQRNGRPYQAIERRYAIFPQRSGELRVDGPLFSGQVTEPGQRRGSLRDRMFGGRDPFAQFDNFFGSDPFADMRDPFARGRPLHLRGRGVVLDVQPQPAGASTPWLPAESLTLNEVWLPDPPIFRVGEPIKRTIAITAQGLSATQLPDLNLTAAPALNVYPDKPQVQTRAEGDTLIAQKVIKAAVVPTAAGRITLPAVALEWWDTQAGESRVARLPARDIEVLPGPAGASNAATAKQSPARQSMSAAPAPAQVESPDSLAASDVTVAVASTGGAGGARGSDDLWPYLVLLLILALLATTVRWLRARSSTHEPSLARTNGTGAPLPVTADAAQARERVERYCRAGDAKAARQALLDWAAAVWPGDSPRRLDELAARLGAVAVSTLRELDRYLYAAGSGSQRADWDGAAAWRLLEPLMKKATGPNANERRESALPPLYPQGEKG